MSAPKFQHRHYAPLAELLHRHRTATFWNDDKQEALASLANELETMFAMDNEHFDRQRWRDAWRGQPSTKDKRTAAKVLQS